MRCPSHCESTFLSHSKVSFLSTALKRNLFNNPLTRSRILKALMEIKEKQKTQPPEPKNDSCISFAREGRSGCYKELLAMLLTTVWQQHIGQVELFEKACLYRDSCTQFPHVRPTVYCLLSHGEQRLRAQKLHTIRRNQLQNTWSSCNSQTMIVQILHPAIAGKKIMMLHAP